MSDSKKRLGILGIAGSVEPTRDFFDVNNLDIGLLRELFDARDRRVWVKKYFKEGEGIISRVDREPDETFCYTVIFKSGFERTGLSKEDLLDDPGELVRELVE
jgi:hypothetical protein